MQSPDFAIAGLPTFQNRDLLFLFEHFPVPGIDAVEAVRRVHQHPSTLESILESRYVHDSLLGAPMQWLDVSPRLFFDVMLRHALPGPRDSIERQTIHYLANLLGLFVSTERLYRLQADDDASYEYLADLVAEASQADRHRRFLAHAHIGNYALYLSGVCASWVAYRRDFKRRPVSLEYYKRMGRSYYATAAGSDYARDFGLHEIFRHLASRFEHFRGGLQKLAEDVFPRKGVAA